MWNQNRFVFSDPALIASFIRENALGSLITRGKAYPEATLIPMEWEENEQRKAFLRGHIALANPQNHDLIPGTGVLALFTSPVGHYISSSWYEKPNVPTWNYMVAKVEGRIRLLEGTELWNSLNNLMLHHEQGEHPVIMAELPPEVMKQIQGITGFEIEVEQAECHFKMSQNRSDRDYASIISELEKAGTQSAMLMAQAMRDLRTIS